MGAYQGLTLVPRELTALGIDLAFTGHLVLIALYVSIVWW